jgi:sugar phosphate isomerase/epimerase
MNPRLAVATGCCSSCSILSTLEHFHHASVTAVELGTHPRHFEAGHPDQLRDVRAALKRMGIAPVSIHAPFGGVLELSDPNPTHRQAAIDAVLTAASALSELGGFQVVVHPSDVERTGQNVAERLARSTSALESIARACADMGTTLLLETPLPHLIGGDPGEFAWILERLESSVGVCIDTGHVTLGGHWDRMIEVTADRLKHVHASDNHGRFDDHLPPGDGRIDWGHIRRTLERVGFDGWIVLELSCPGQPIAEHVGRALRRAGELLAPSGKETPA